MTFHSILFEGLESSGERIALEPPEFFCDLNLDQIVDAITAGRQEYNLKPFFYTRLSDLGAVTYRHQIMQDLEKEALLQTVRDFSTQMRTMRRHLAAAKEAYHKYEKERWFLEAADLYCKAIKDLLRGLFEGDPGSRGLLAFRAYLSEYTGSARFRRCSGKQKN